MFKDFGKELGQDIQKSAQIMKLTGKELGNKIERVGNIEKAAQNLKDGMIITSGIIMGGILLNTILKKI